MVGDVASRTKLPKATENNPREKPPATNGGFGASGALPRADNFVEIENLVFSRSSLWQAPPAPSPKNVVGNAGTANHCKENYPVRTISHKPPLKILSVFA